MNEKKLWEQIKNSLEYEAVPEELQPEQMKERLLEYQKRITKMRDVFEKEDTAGQKRTEKENTTEGRGETKGFRIRRLDLRHGLSAVAVFAFLCIFGIAAWKLVPDGQMGGEALVADSSPAATGSKGADTERESAEGTGRTDDAQPAMLGDGIYELADGYGSVYDVLESYENSMVREYGWFMGRNTGAEVKEVQYEASESAASEDSGSTVATEDTAASKESGYSTTNLQTEGVDESDIVKTDGEYIYQVSSRKVNIYDIREGGLELLETVVPSDLASSDTIKELYVQGDVLSLVLAREDTGMDKESEYVYRVNTVPVTSVMTYDISDRSRPELIGEYTQDGYYLDSRKTGQTIYLFTTQMLGLPQVERNKAVAQDYVGAWLPCINEEPIASGDIYLSKRGGNAVVIGSFDCQTPEKLIDSKMIISESTQVYVSQKAIYLYRTTYDQRENTEIAKFDMKDGQLNAVGAISIKGSVLDSFAINEYNGYLRVLTTDWSDVQESNYVFVLDENLDTVGSIDGLAEGEEIYSARFMGEIGYFVTYENTDPLFSVDFSKPEEPKVIGELKITGFSEYLHFWGEDKLLGIGYETDPVSGMTEGIKLSMFDISNPAHVTECAKIVLSNADYSPALYEYKTVLVSKAENLIGFAVECYDEQRTQYDYETKYLLYAYEDGKFENLMAETLHDANDLSNIRGLYADGRFFLANEKWIVMYNRDSYDMEKEIGR